MKIKKKTFTEPKYIVLSTRRCGSHMLVNFLNKHYSINKLAPTANFTHGMSNYFSLHSDTKLFLLTRKDFWKHCLSVCYAEETGNYQLHTQGNRGQWDPKQVQISDKSFGKYLDYISQWCEDTNKIEKDFQFVYYEDLLKYNLPQIYLKTPVNYTTIITNLDWIEDQIQENKLVFDKVKKHYAKLEQTSTQHFDFKRRLGKLDLQKSK